MGKGKSKSGWLVLSEGGSVIYSGPDRVIAREKAEKALADDDTAEVVVYRYSRRVSLAASSLVRSLPRKAF